MKQAIRRFKSKTPDFFKRLQVVGGSLVVLCSGILKTENISGGFEEMAKQGIVAGTMMIIVSQFAVKSSAPIK